MPLRPGTRFSDIYRTGSRSRQGGLTVIASKGRSDFPEVGVVAGKKVGNAVKRNRAKRRMREAAMQAPLVPGGAYVFVASHDVPEVAFSDLVEWMTAGVTAVNEKERL